MKIFELGYTEGVKVRVFDISPPVTFQEQFTGIMERRQDPKFGDYLADNRRLKQFKAVGLLRDAAITFAELRGSYPCSLMELLASGVSCFDTDSTNPLTGVPFTGDGSADDIYFEWLDDDVLIQPVMSDGTVWEHYMTL